MSSKKKYKRKKNNGLTIFIFVVIVIICVLFSYFFFIKDNTELSEYDKELKMLDNVNERISFFKEENIDRYVAYMNKHNSLSPEMVVVYVNVGLDKDFYTDVKESPNKNTNIVLANKFFSLGNDYVPNDLVAIDSKYSSGKKSMQSDATKAFNEMAKSAKEDGYNIRAISTYRSYNYQNGLYTRYANQDGKEIADTYSARAGHSEHQTGLAVDVDNGSTSYTNFGNTKEFNWMKENAYKYGFILRYTKENEWITGYKDEPWHYRYVGIEIASYIQKNPMTFEEYFVRFLDK